MVIDSVAVIYKQLTVTVLLITLAFMFSGFAMRLYVWGELDVHIVPYCAYLHIPEIEYSTTIATQSTLVLNLSSEGTTQYVKYQVTPDQYKYHVMLTRNPENSDHRSVKNY